MPDTDGGSFRARDFGVGGDLSAALCVAARSGYDEGPDHAPSLRICPLLLKPSLLFLR